jgi:hypothetical protein
MGRENRRPSLFWASLTTVSSGSMMELSSSGGSRRRSADAGADVALQTKPQERSYSLPADRHAHRSTVWLSWSCRRREQARELGCHRRESWMLPKIIRRYFSMTRFRRSICWLLACCCSSNPLCCARNIAFNASTSSASRSGKATESTTAVCHEE